MADSEKKSTPSAISNPNEPADAICKDCSCKVEVAGFKVIDVPSPALDGWKPSYEWKQFGHLFIKYTLSDGTQRYYRGGPTNKNALEVFDKKRKDPDTEKFDHQNNPPSGNYKTDETTIDDGWWSKSSKFGAIIGHSGLYRGSYEEHSFNVNPRGIVTVAEGKSHCNYHNEFRKILREIMSLRIEYEADGPNSNSVVYTLLKHAGLPTNKPGGTTFPGWGEDLLGR